MLSEKTDGAQNSFNLASQTVSDAVAFDNKHSYREAHALYLKAVTLFESSMDAELNETKLNVLKNRITAYKKRAAELDSFLKVQRSSNDPVRINDLEVAMGVTQKTIDATAPVAGQATEARLERMVYALGAVVGILLVAVVVTFTMLQIHVAENADLNSELEVTQAHLSTVASSVLRLSTAPSGAAQSDDTLFTELENMNSGMTMDFSAEIEEVKLGLVSMNSHIDAKVDLSAMESCKPNGNQLDEHGSLGEYEGRCYGSLREKRS